VYLSGFPDNDPTSKEEIVAKLKDLNIQVWNGKWDEKITHVVSPKTNARTMKTLAGRLTNKWVVGADWVHHSHEKKTILPEHNYGKQGKTSPFRNVKFFIDPSFTSQYPTSNDNYKNLLLLLTVAQATLEETPNNAQYIIKSESEQNDSNNEKNTSDDLPSGIKITFSEFIQVIERNVYPSKVQ